jgi:hypothetical protein
MDQTMWKTTTEEIVNNNPFLNAKKCIFSIMSYDNKKIVQSWVTDGPVMMDGNGGYYFKIPNADFILVNSKNIQIEIKES